MALLVMDGFEFAPQMRFNLSVMGSNLNAVTGRDGVGKAVQLTSGASLIVPLPSVTTAIVGVGFWVPSGITGAPFTIMGDGTVTTHLTIMFDGAGHVIVRRGISSGTVIATSTNVIAGDTWHWFEIKASVADAGGICIVKVDGNTEINFTGDTKNAGIAAGISAVILTGAPGNPRYDDLVICDTTGGTPWNDFFGEKVIKLKTPNGNGATSQWLGSDADSVNNYLLVDDNPVSATDYTSSGVTGDRDLYALTNASGMASVDAVQNLAYIAKSDAGARSVKTITRNSGGTITSSPSIPLSTTYNLLQGGIEQTDPSGAAWTAANVNTIQAGVEAV